MSKMGRPSLYSHELADLILKRISEGETVSQICSCDDMPARSTVWLWSATHAEFSSKYVRAINSLAQCEVDDLANIEGMLIRGEIDPQTARVLSDNKKWKAAKFYPKSYGEKQTIESKNENLNANVEMKLSDEDMQILARFGFKE